MLQIQVQFVPNWAVSTLESAQSTPFDSFKRARRIDIFLRLSNPERALFIIVVGQTDITRRGQHGRHRPTAATATTTVVAIACPAGVAGQHPPAWLPSAAAAPPTPTAQAAGRGRGGGGAGRGADRVIIPPAFCRCHRHRGRRRWSGPAATPAIRVAGAGAAGPDAPDHSGVHGRRQHGEPEQQLQPGLGRRWGWEHQ